MAVLFVFAMVAVSTIVAGDVDVWETNGKVLHLNQDTGSFQVLFICSLLVVFTFFLGVVQ